MLTKRSVIVLLLGLNLLLAGALVIESYSWPAAYAQELTRSGNFVCVTAKPAAKSYEVLYVLDATDHKLYAFYPTAVRRNQLTPVMPRNLRVDFNHK